MKFLVIIFLSAINCPCFGQEDNYVRDSTGRLISKTPLIEINSLNHNHYYQKSKQLLDINNGDSLFKAYQILTKLHYFNSTVYANNILAPDFAKIEETNLNNIKKNIVGTWSFEWSGSNWGTAETYKTNNELIVFTCDQASFFKGDSLVKITPYIITNEFSTSLKEFIFQVYFPEDKTAYDISFKTSGADYTAHLAFSKDNMALYLDTPGDCSGCARAIYMTQTAKNYRTGQ